MLYLASLLSFLMTTDNYGYQGVSKEITLSKYSQTSQSWLDDSLEIQYIDLHVNPLLFSEVKKYIKEQQDSCQLFRNGFGYISIGGIKLDRIGQPVLAGSLNDHLKDILVEFNIGLSSFYPHQGIGKPLYYSFVNNRLVLFFDQNLKWVHHNTFSSSSVNKLKKLIKATLTQSFEVDFEFKDMAGKLFTLSKERRENMSEEQILETGSFTFQKLKTVVKHFDGSISYRFRN